MPIEIPDPVLDVEQDYDVESFKDPDGDPVYRVGFVVTVGQVKIFKHEDSIDVHDYNDEVERVKDDTINRFGERLKELLK